MKQTKRILATAVLLTGLLSGSLFAQNTFPSFGSAGINTTSPLADMHIIHNGGYVCPGPLGGGGGTYPINPGLLIEDNYHTNGTASYAGHNLCEMKYNYYDCTTGLLINKMLFFVNSNDNVALVGINKNTATEALDVGGNIQADGNIHANGNVSANGDIIGNHNGSIGLDFTVGHDGTISNTLSVGNNLNVGGSASVTGIIHGSGNGAIDVDFKVGNTLQVGNLATVVSEPYVITCDGITNVLHKQSMASLTAGDNLGNHVATMNLNMSTHDISNVGSINCGSITASGISCSSLGSLTSISSVSMDCTNLHVTGTAVGSALFDGDIQVVSTIYTSDERFKKNIVPLRQVRDRLFQVNPYSYEYRKDHGSSFKFNDKQNFGFIAQEIQKIYPNLVSEVDTKGHLGVEYVQFIPLLLAAIKEQDAEVADLKSEINQLQSQIDEIKSNLVSNTTSVGSTNGTKDEEGLWQNTPNPFSGQTTIRYKLNKTYASVYVGIYDLNGKEVARQNVSNSKEEITFSSNELSKGMYMYSLVADGRLIDTKKMIVE